jgi:lipopolysaccharide biosynthesis protein
MAFLAARDPRVIDLAMRGVRVERGGASSEASNDGRVAVLAHFSTLARISLSFRTLVEQFVCAGYRVIVVSSATCPTELDWGPAELADVIVLRKPNVGYDFGSWAVALDRFPAVRAAEHVVLANDSLVGPFATIDPLLHEFEETRADVWGLTETLQFSRHLQSYFIGFRRGVLEERPLADFWSDVRHYEDKNLVIHRNELGLGRLLQDEGYAVDAAFVAEQVVPAADNPTIIGWHRLLAGGFPFVKRELVRTPTLAPDGAEIKVAVKEIFGVDVEDWLS